jgi:hypothetical protein
VRRSGPLKRSGRVRRRSPTREALEEARRELVGQVLAERPQCEFTACRARSQDCHEILTRARGGSILDRLNIVALCREHHDWVGAHQALAESMGLLRHSWDPPIVDPSG